MAAREALSSSSLRVLRIATQIKEIAETTKPKLLITTHEGHAYERMIFGAVRMVEPEVQCIGYIHAPIFQKQHAVKRNLSYEYNPDVIFTSGHIQINQLKEAEQLKNIPFKVLGSIRCFEPNESIYELKSKNSIKLQNQLSCLVIPEGIESEINKLFEFSLKCAKSLPEVTFTWRLHPLFSFEILNCKNKLFQSLPANIKFSEKNIKEDFKDCQWVLYRGSSAVIQAVVAGLKPIYLHFSGEMKIDPIYEINNWKNEIESVQDAQATLKNGAGNYTDYGQARKYCLDMYTPLDNGMIFETMIEMNRNE